MSLQNLPSPVQGLLKAIQHSQSAELAPLFVEDGILIDKAKHYRTHAAIQEWSEKALVEHKATIIVHDAGAFKDEIWVKVTMDGDFEADYGITEPFTLHFHIYLYQEEIRLLRIDTIAPDEPTMRAVWASHGNEDDPLSAIRNDVWKIPVAPSGWVKVKVAAVGLNYHDIFTLRGIAMHGLKYPLILGNEGAGTSEDGTEVVIFPVMGDPNFAGDITLDSNRHVLGELTQGALAGYVIIPESNIVKRPKAMSFETASVLGIAWLTAYRMLFTRSGMKKGQKMLVQGSSGGVSTAVIQMGRAAGMIVWCTGRSEKKRELAIKLGAHRTFIPGKELPEKVDAVFDVSGAQTFEHSVSSVKAGGTVVSCGLHSGGLKVELDIMKLFTQQVNIHGVYAGNRDEFEKLIQFVADHNIQPHIGLTLPLDRAEEGLKMILNGEVQGKVVVRI